MQFLNIPAEKIVVIHEAVDKENFRRATNPQAVEAKLRSWNVRKPFLLSVSSLWRYKNQTGIARAFARLIQKYNVPHQLVFVGGSDQPDYEAEVRALVQELGVQERTRFLGYLPHSELAYCYQAADVFVYPSFFETFGLTLLEAMACGTPIVCSDRGSLPEIAGAAALTVNPEKPEEIAEAIARLLFDSTVRDSLVANGYRRLQEFSWQKTAEQTLTVLLRAGRESRERQTARNGSTAAT
jgi:glycosyltransferase involved in cell wall biosynthesis